MNRAKGVGSVLPPQPKTKCFWLYRGELATHG